MPVANGSLDGLQYSFRSRYMANTLGIMSEPFFSIVIPFYNRSWAIGRAISSAVQFCSGSVCEIILVNDGSTDNSVDLVRENIVAYKNFPKIVFRLIEHDKNRGVCAAKNTGGKAAIGKWVVFLDSDDELIPASYSALRLALIESESYPLHFFSCIEQNVEYQSCADVTSLRDFNTLLLRGTGGEALPVIRSAVFREYGYDEDIRGYESLCYLRIVRDYSHAIIHSLVARRYYTDHSDRLSSRAGMRGRWHDLSRGHRRVLEEHVQFMSKIVIIKQLIRFFKSRLLAALG